MQSDENGLESAASDTPNKPRGERFVPREAERHRPGAALEHLKKTLPALYRLFLALWVGGAALFTFVLTPAIFKNYDRDMAGGIVGVLFPGYFAWGLICGAAALACLLLGGVGRRKKLAAGLLCAMLAVALVQNFYIEPKAAELKAEIPSFVTTPPDNPLRQEFRKLHGFSMAINLGVVGSGALLLLIL